MALNKRRINTDRLSTPPPITLGTLQPYQGIDVASNILDSAESGKSLVYFDPDMDGLIAGLFFCKVLKRRGIGFQYYINERRLHGFLVEPETVRGMTVFNGDFMVPRDIVRNMVNNDVSLLSLDHHECEENLIHETGPNGREGIVINNQYPFEDKDNRYQSGAGVTFEVLREIEPWLDTPENRALVGITLLTDVRNINNERAAGYLWELYNHANEGYVGYLIETTKPTRDYDFGVRKLDRSYVDFRLGPSVNSMLRYNKEDEAVKFILKGGYPDVDFQGSQKKLVEKMGKNATKRKYSHLVIVEVDANDFNYDEQDYISNFIGILCSRNTDDGRSCIGIVYNTIGEIERASFRGNLQESPYRELLLEVLYGLGHNIAFGILEIDPTEETFTRANELCAKAEEDSVYSQRYIEVKNLKQFSRTKNALLAEWNSYRNGSDRVFIRYTGESIEHVRGSSKFDEWSINDEKVMSFDITLKPTEDYILPIFDRGKIKYYLDSRFNEKYAQKITIDAVDLGSKWYKSLDF